MVTIGKIQIKRGYGVLLVKFREATDKNRCEIKFHMSTVKVTVTYKPWFSSGV